MITFGHFYNGRKRVNVLHSMLVVRSVSVCSAYDSNLLFCQHFDVHTVVITREHVKVSCLIFWF